MPSQKASEEHHRAEHPDALADVVIERDLAAELGDAHEEALTLAIEKSEAQVAVAVLWPLAEKARETDATLRGQAQANADAARAQDERDLPRIVSLFLERDEHGKPRHIVKTVAAEMAKPGAPFSEARVTRLRKLARERGLLPKR